MKAQKDKKVSDFYSSWFGVVSALSLAIFLICSFLPTIEFTTQDNLVFAPNLYSLFFGFSIKLVETGEIQEVAKFNLLIMIPYILVLLAMLVCLLMPISSAFGVLSSGLMIGSAILITQVSNYNFYANSVLATWAPKLSNSTVTMQFGYYASFIALYASGGFTLLMTLLMRIKAVKNYKQTQQTPLGLASRYRPDTKKKKKSKTN